MAQVKLDLRSLTVLQKIQFGRQVVTAMTGNVKYPAPNPTLAEVTAVTDTLETNYNTAQEKERDRSLAVDVLHDSEGVFDRVITQEGSYVQTASGGDAETILTAAMGVRDDKSPSHLPAQPQDPTVTEGDMPGEIDFHWSPVKGKTAYVVQLLAGANPTGAWGGDKVNTKSKIELMNLVSGTRYWLRVAAVNAAGQGPWSNPVGKIAP